MKSKKSKKNSLAIAIYFGIGVGIIILISIIFKGIDLIRESRFDSNHRISVVIVGSNSSQVLSISPKEGTIFRMNIKGSMDAEKLKDLSVPIDAYVNAKNFDEALQANPKSEFAKLLFKLNKIKTNLSFVDLLRLSIFSGGIDSDKIEEEVVGAGDTSKISDISSNFFKDPLISSEKVNIQITNTTQIPGFGNKLAKYITNLGGIVILVSSSPSEVPKSKIVSLVESETVKRLSKTLGIPYEKGQGSDLADVIIILGEDKKDLFK